MKKIVVVAAIAAFSLMGFGAVAQTPQKTATPATKEQKATSAKEQKAEPAKECSKDKKACCKDKKEACKKGQKACCKDKKATSTTEIKEATKK